jgi:hypothetical protein
MLESSLDHRLPYLLTRSKGCYLANTERRNYFTRAKRRPNEGSYCTSPCCVADVLNTERSTNDHGSFWLSLHNS